MSQHNELLCQIICLVNHFDLLLFVIILAQLSANAQRGTIKSVHTVEWKESVFKSISFWSMKCIFSELAPSKTHFQGESYYRRLQFPIVNRERPWFIWTQLSADRQMGTINWIITHSGTKRKDNLKAFQFDPWQTNGNHQLNHYAERNEKKRQLKSISFRSIRSIIHIWVNCYCWGNSSILEGRFSKWF